MKKQLILSVMAVAALATGSIFAAAEPVRIPLYIDAVIPNLEGEEWRLGVSPENNPEANVSMAEASNEDAVAQKAFNIIRTSFFPNINEADYNITVRPKLGSALPSRPKLGPDLPSVRVFIRPKKRAAKVVKDRFPAGTAVYANLSAIVVGRNSDGTYTITTADGTLVSGVSEFSMQPRKR